MLFPESLWSSDIDHFAGKLCSRYTLFIKTSKIKVQAGCC